MRKERIKVALDNVLGFAGEITLMVLNEENPTSEKIEDIKKECKILNDANLYPFDINKNHDEFVDQIRDFANKVNG